MEIQTWKQKRIIKIIILQDSEMYFFYMKECIIIKKKSNSKSLQARVCHSLLLAKNPNSLQQ